jgi:hypothetical protein
MGQSLGIPIAHDSRQTTVHRQEQIMFDIDIDVGDRDKLLKLVAHTPASIHRDGLTHKHNTGIYVNPIPANPITGYSNIDYQMAEQLGYVKLDILNVHVYNHIKDPAHLNHLLETEPVWDLLRDQDFVSRLIHVNGHYDLLQQHFPDTMDKLAMVLALIRPSKRYLVGKSWREIADEIWIKPADGYYFKKAHAYGYAQLVMIHMNLLSEFTD